MNRPKQTTRLHTLGLLLAATLAAAGCANTAPTLAQRWSQLHQAQPKLHPRDAARQLGVSEAQLLAAGTTWQATRLKADTANIQALYEHLPELGRIKAITRNDDMVLERAGAVVPTRRDEQGRVVPGTGLAGGPIDLRLGSVQWGSAFAVVEPGRDGTSSRSLQFFDRQGQAVHKVYLDNDQHVADFEQLVARFRANDQAAPLLVEPLPKSSAAAVRGTPSAADIAELRQSWQELSDVHQFPRLLRELKLSREQALELVGADAAWRIGPQALQLLLEDAKSRGQPIMVFVGSGGLTQIYSGPVERTSGSGGWYQAQAADFRLQVRSAAIDHGWVVRRPTDHGIVTSVEFYDAGGRQLVNFFSRRQRGQPETEQWRRMVGALPRG